jgi:4-hydroxy-tetrahydrodipicolinate synthase
MQNGGAGCISATANINPAAINALYANWQSDDAAKAQKRLDLLRDVVQKYPMIPALKAIVSNFSGDSEWEAVRPPLVLLASENKKGLMTSLDQYGFTMPGLTKKEWKK